MGYPNAIINSPDDRNVLRKIFSYYAPVYYLDDYESVFEGAGQRIWDMIQKERDHQKIMAHVKGSPRGFIGKTLDALSVL